jgi:hypothetical protein
VNRSSGLFPFKTHFASLRLCVEIFFYILRGIAWKNKPEILNFYLGK